MTDTPSDDLAEIDEEDLDDIDDDVRALIDDLRAESDAALRSAIRYTADDYDVLFLREDVAAALSAAEREGSCGRIPREAGARSGFGPDR